MKIRNILATAITAVMLMAAVVTPVHADENCDNTGPYGICTPKTDITVGDVVIKEEVVAGMGLAYLAGAAFIANGSQLKKFTK